MPQAAWEWLGRGLLALCVVDVVGCLGYWGWVVWVVGKRLALDDADLGHGRDGRA